jgi:hypothetical protein
MAHSSESFLAAGEEVRHHEPSSTASEMNRAGRVQVGARVVQEDARPKTTIRRRQLEHLRSLSYVLECGVLGYNGELKSALGELCSDLELPEQGLPSLEVRSKLQNAYASYRGNDYRKAASELAGASNAWWREILKM